MLQQSKGNYPFNSWSAPPASFEAWASLAAALSVSSTLSFYIKENLGEKEGDTGALRCLVGETIPRGSQRDSVLNQDKMRTAETKKDKNAAG